MSTFLHTPAFLAFSWASLVLCLNLMFLWGYSGVVRGRTKTMINEEDAKLLKMNYESAEPDAVARVLRAHRNAEASTWPFLFLALVFVLLGGSATWVGIYCGTFTVARLGHSISYLRALQPWRTIAFSGGMTATVALALHLLWLLLRAF